MVAHYRIAMRSAKARTVVGALGEFFCQLATTFYCTWVAAEMRGTRGGTAAHVGIGGRVLAFRQTKRQFFFTAWWAGLDFHHKSHHRT